MENFHLDNFELVPEQRAFLKVANRIGVLTEHSFAGREMWVYARAAAMGVEEQPALFEVVAEEFAALADADETVMPFFLRAAEAFERSLTP